MSTQKYIRSITEITPDDFPTLTPLPEDFTTTTGNISSSFFANITLQTWVIIFLVLALLGINIFAYLAKGTQETAIIVKQVFGPILSFFGYNTLQITKQTIETSATGTKAGVDIIAGATTGAIDTIQDTAENGLPIGTTGTVIGLSTNNLPSPNTNITIPQGQHAISSLQVQNRTQQAENNVEQTQQDSLEKALSNASQHVKYPEPDNSMSTIQSGKSGWCFIGEDQGIRTCAEIGVNDGCMSGDVFPNQSICMNPKLRV